MTITFPEDISMRFGLVRLASGGPSSTQLRVSALDLAPSFPLLRPLSTLNACARPGIVLPLEFVSHPLRKILGDMGFQPAFQSGDQGRVLRVVDFLSIRYWCSVVVAMNYFALPVS